MPATESGLPIATVIIPTFNDMEHLTEAVGIACRQTLREIEIIVVDDGSTVSVEPTVRAIAGAEEVIVIRRPMNGGVFVAQNTGIERARGKYIYLGSTNDPVEPNFVEMAINALERWPAAGMSFLDPGIISAGSERRDSFSLHLANKETYFDPDQFAELLRRRPFHLSSNTVVFRADCLRAIGGCRSEFGLFADWFICNVVALRKGTVYVPEVLAFSRIHEDAFSDRSRWNTSARSQYARAVLRAIATEFPEICCRLRYSRAASEFGVRVILALRNDPVFRSLIGVSGLAMAFIRGTWNLLRRLMPDSGRRLVRKIAMNSRIVG